MKTTQMKRMLRVLGLASKYFYPLIWMMMMMVMVMMMMMMMMMLRYNGSHFHYFLKAFSC